MRRARFVSDGVELTSIMSDCPEARRVLMAPLDLDDDVRKPIISSACAQH